MAIIYRWWFSFTSYNSEQHIASVVDTCDKLFTVNKHKLLSVSNILKWPQWDAQRPEGK
jgi:hypothetical protein